MKINLEMAYGRRRIVIRSMWFCNTNQAWLVSTPRHRMARLTSIIYWLRTGKRLRKGQVIHHVDHDPCNNVFANFELTTRSKHAAIHHTGRKNSVATIKKMQKSARRWARTPKYRKIASMRAKRQHREKNFGHHTWRTR